MRKMRIVLIELIGVRVKYHIMMIHVRRHRRRHEVSSGSILSAVGMMQTSGRSGRLVLMVVYHLIKRHKGLF